MQSVSLHEMQTAIRAASAGIVDRERLVPHVSIDSRSVERGELFWALRGEKHDGHCFVDEAWRRGAIACVVEKASQIAGRGPQLIVENTEAALQEFAHRYRQRSEALIIGVTGSVGKTTTRDMLHAVLSAKYAGRRSQKNFNNEIGLPLSLLDLE